MLQLKSLSQNFLGLVVIAGLTSPVVARASELQCEDIFANSSARAGMPSRSERQVREERVERSREEDRQDVRQAGADEFTAEYPDLEEKYRSVLEMVDPTSAQPLLSLVIPAYREAQRLPDSLEKLQRFLNRFPFPVEVLVMVEKSPDQTYELASQRVAGDPRIQVIDNQVKHGKGYAVRSGMRRASGKYVLFMDADLSTPLPEIINFMNGFKADPELKVLIGDRKSNASTEKQHRSVLRRAFSYGFNRLTRMVSVEGIEDTQAGFKAFTQDASREIFKYQSLNGFAFDVEVLVLAEKLKLKTESEPIKWYDDSRSTVNPFLDPIRMAIDLVKVRYIVRRNLRAQARLSSK